MAWASWLKVAAGVGLIALTGGVAAPAGFLLFGSAALTTGVLGLGISLALGGISDVLRKPLSGSLLNDANGRLKTIRQSASPRRVIYGDTRVGGVLTFGHANGITSHPTDQNQLIITICGHAIDTIYNLQFDDEYPDIDMTTGLGAGPYANKLFYRSQLGYDGDVGFSSVMVGATPWTANHRQRGCAAAYVRINFDEKIFPGGVPNMTFHGRWKLVFDPRINSPIDITDASNATPIVITKAGHGFIGGESIRLVGAEGNTNANGTWGVDYISSTQFSLQGSNGNAAYTSGGQLFELGYSNNAALVIADYLMDPWIGLGVAYASIRENVLIAAANVCDEDVEIVASPYQTEKRYTINGTFETSEKPGEILTQMANAMAGHVTNVGGEWHIIPGAFRLAVMEITDADIVAPMQVQSKRSKRDLINGVKGTYPSADHGWVETDFPAVTGATYLAADGGTRAWKDIFLPFTTSATAAQRLALIDLERNRRQLSVSLTCTMRAYELQPGDVVELTHSRYSWALETFEVAECGLEQKDGALVVSLQLVQTDVDVYGFAVDEYGNLIDPDLLDLLSRKVPFGWSPQMAPGQNQTADTAPLHVRTDYGFNIAQQYRMGADGSAIPQLRVGGFMPTNLFSTAISRPRVRTLSASYSASGGFIRGGERYYIALVAEDGGLGGSPVEYSVNRITALSDVAVVDIPQESPEVNTNTITITNIQWHAGTTGWYLLFGPDKFRLSTQPGAGGNVLVLGSWVSVVGSNEQPSSITFNGSNPINGTPKGYFEHLRGSPDQRFDHLRLMATRAIHLGIWGGEVLSVEDADSPVTKYKINLAANFLDESVSPPVTPDLAGRYISLMGLRNSGFVHQVGGGMPLADFMIESNDDTSVTLAADQLNPAGQGIDFRSVVVIRTKATAVGEDDTGQYIDDSGFGLGGQLQGDNDPNIGGGDDSLQGKVIRCIYGTGIGESRIIKGNVVASGRIYFDGTNPFAVGDVFIVLDPHTTLVYDTATMETENQDTFADIRIDAPNLYGDQFIVDAISVSQLGKEAPLTSSPYREIYMFGQADPGEVLTEATVLSPTQGIVRASGTFTITLPDAAQLPGRRIVIINQGLGVITVAAPNAHSIDGTSTDTLNAGEVGVYGGYDD